MNDKRPRGHVRYDNAGRVVIVTGGASGIGHAICLAFADSGAHVVCADVNEPGDPFPASVAQRKCDTSNEQQCQQTVDDAINEFGAVDVLVNNAAIQPRDSYRPIDQLPTDVWNRMVAVNLSGYTFMAKHVLRHMRAAKSGVIVNIASGQAHRTAREVGVYGPLKAANLMQTRQWGVVTAQQPRHRQTRCGVFCHRV